MNRYLFIFILLMYSCTTGAQHQSGKVVGVKDGDTIEMMINNKRVVVRLEGIDCPEKGQAFGNKAKSFTSDLVFGKEVSVNITSYDRFKRAIAVVYMSGNKVLNEELLKAGMAWHFKKYNQDAVWARLETKARKSKIGLWSDPNPVPPWEFRKSRRKG